MNGEVLTILVDRQARFPKVLDLVAWHSVTVLIPHADDESIGCGGLLSQLAGLDCFVRVILVTDSSGGGDLPEGTSNIRKAEFKAALAQLGDGFEVDFWDFPDGQLEAHALALEKKLFALATEKPTEFVLAPWVLDLHPDHASLGWAAVRTHLRGGFTQGMWFYEVWSPLPATHILSIAPVWPRKREALLQHTTALACGEYERAMTGLAAYRSLLLPNERPGSSWAEAFCGWRFSLSLMRYRLAEERDGEAIVSLFEQTFGASLPEHWWHWKYAHQNLRGALACALGESVAFYGVLPRQMILEGRAWAVCQIADVMVLPAWQGRGGRRGVFFETSTFFLSHFVGQGCDFALAFGFPTPRALTLGVKTGLYQKADALAFWQGSLSGSPSAVKPLPWGVSFEEEDAKALSDWSWLLRCPFPLTVTDKKAVWLTKTPEAWQWRFGQHPTDRFVVIRCFRWGRLLGAVVLKRLPTGGGEIMDVALTSAKVSTIVLRVVQHWAKKNNLPSLQSWGTTLAIAAIAGALGGRSEPAGALALPGKMFESEAARQSAQHWILLGGDTDFR